MSTRAQNPLSDNPPEKLTRTVVPDGERLEALPNHFGVLAFIFEGKVYDWMEFLSADYRGGYLEFYRLSNSGFYMAPKTEASFHIVNPGNYFEGDLSADAAGIAACCFALSTLSFDYPDNAVFAERFYQLRDFAIEHAEGAEILRLLD